MYELSGTYETPHGSKYLQQLCKHFAHKIDVSFNETEGTCGFQMGPAYLSANESGLSVRFELKDQAGVADAKHVIDAHLERFAFREDFTGLAWSE